MDDSFTRSSLVKSEPIHACIIIEGGIFTIFSMEGTQFHMSVLIFRNTCPLSLAGAVMSNMVSLSPFSQLLMVTERDQSGRITVITISPWLVRPRLFSSDFWMISFAVGVWAIASSLKNRVTKKMRMVLHRSIR